MKHKNLSAITAALLLTTFFAGCGGQSQPKSNSTATDSSQGQCINSYPEEKSEPESKPEEKKQPPPIMNAEELFSAYEFFDPYYLNQKGKDLISQQIYNDLVDRFCGREETFHWTVKEPIPLDFTFLLRQNFPFSTLAKPTQTADGFTLTYSYDEKEHRQKMFELADMVETILATVASDTDSAVGYALSLYRYLTTTTDYVNGGDGFPDVESVLLGQPSGMLDILNTYRYLLGLLGVESELIDSSYAAVKLDGKYYLMELGYDQRETDGKGLNGFGLLPGQLPEEQKLPPNLDYATENRFAPLQEDILAWTFTEDGKSIEIFYEDRDEPELFPLT